MKLPSLWNTLTLKVHLKHMANAFCDVPWLSNPWLLHGLLPGLLHGLLHGLAPKPCLHRGIWVPDIFLTVHGSRIRHSRRPKLRRNGGHLQDAQLFQQGHEATPRVQDITRYHKVIHGPRIPSGKRWEKHASILEIEGQIVHST